MKDLQSPLSSAFLAFQILGRIHKTYNRSKGRRGKLRNNNNTHEILSDVGRDRDPSWGISPRIHCILHPKRVRGLSGALSTAGYTLVSSYLLDVGSGPADSRWPSSTSRSLLSILESNTVRSRWSSTSLISKGIQLSVHTQVSRANNAPTTA